MEVLSNPFRIAGSLHHGTPFYSAQNERSFSLCSKCSLATSDRIGIPNPSNRTGSWKSDRSLSDGIEER